MKMSVQEPPVKTGGVMGWVKSNSNILINAGTLVCTLGITSGLGFSYWWFAARQFSNDVVGFAQAANVAMAFLANFCLLGLGTLLITELPRRKGQEASLISTALIVVGVVGASAGVLFAVVAPFVVKDLEELRSSLLNILLFAAGVSLTSMVLILDQVFIAMLRGGLQLWRNAIFSVGKLLALFAVSLWISQELGVAIYAAWAVGNFLSFVSLVGFVLWKGKTPLRSYWPDWRLLRRLGVTALLHHMLNLILQAPTLILPLIVASIFPLAANAWFGNALLIVTFLFAISTSLTVVLHATNPSDHVVLREKTRMTVSVAVATALAAGTILQIGAEPILSLFGTDYVLHSSPVLRILAFGALPLIVKDHYIAVCRIKDTVAKAIIPIAIGALLELSIATLGANFGYLLGFDGLSGLSLGWVTALYTESLFMFPVVYRVMMHTTLAEEQILQVAQRRTIASVLGNVAVILLPLAAIGLWLFSIPSVHAENMTSIGLVSVFPPSMLFALLLLAISFCVALQRPRIGIMVLHIGLLIFMLYGVTAMVEAMPRFDIVYRHAGYTEFIMRNHWADPNLDAYFNWPGFFSLTAFVTLIAGFHDVLAYAAWVPVLYNILYFGPMYMIFAKFTSNKQLIWLSLFFFYVTNWIAQDYISPQGFNFFLYLVIIAILLKWFTPAPSQRPHLLERLFSRIPLLARFCKWLTSTDIRSDPSRLSERVIMVLCIIAIFGFSVSGHQLTPIFVLASVAALVLFRQSTLWWLPIVMGLMFAAWIIFMTQAFLAGHIGEVVGDAGNLSTSVGQNVSSRVVGDPGHTFIVEFRLVMTALLWGLAALGGILRARKGFRDSAIVLLALAPFPIFLVQSYGGEVLLRIYLFSQPVAVFLAASLFFLTPPRIRTPNWIILARVALTLTLLGAFLFTRYGNESMDFKSKDEVAGVQQLYQLAPFDSCFFQPWGGTPWQYEQYEHYQTFSFGQDQDDIATMNLIIKQDIPGMEHYITTNMAQSTPVCAQGYLIFTHSQKVAFDLTSGSEPGILDQLENKISRSQDFKMLYSNPDAQIFQFVGTAKGGQ